MAVFSLVRRKNLRAGQCKYIRFVFKKTDFCEEGARCDSSSCGISIDSFSSCG